MSEVKMVNLKERDLEILKKITIDQYARNHLAIHISGKGTLIQSYESVVCFIPAGAWRKDGKEENKIILDYNKWDCSKTTLKYLKQYLRDRHIKWGDATKKEIEKAIKTREILVAELNR